MTINNKSLSISVWVHTKQGKCSSLRPANKTKHDSFKQIKKELLKINETQHRQSEPFEQTDKPFSLQAPETQPKELSTGKEIDFESMPTQDTDHKSKIEKGVSPGLEQQ